MDIIDVAIAVGHFIFVGLLILTIVLIPLALIRPTRFIAGIGYYFAGNAFGFLLWLTSMVLVYQIAGLFWTIIGVITVVGAIPIAFVCVFIRGEWAGLLDLVIAIVGTFGLRILGGFVTSLSGRISTTD